MVDVKRVFVNGTRTRKNQEANHGKHVQVKQEEREYGEDLRQGERHSFDELLHDGGRYQEEYWPAVSADSYRIQQVRRVLSNSTE